MHLCTCSFSLLFTCVSHINLFNYEVAVVVFCWCCCCCVCGALIRKTCQQRPTTLLNVSRSASYNNNHHHLLSSSCTLLVVSPQMHTADNLSVASATHSQYPLVSHILTIVVGMLWPASWPPIVYLFTSPKATVCGQCWQWRYLVLDRHNVDSCWWPTCRIIIVKLYHEYWSYSSISVTNQPIWMFYGAAYDSLIT